MSAEQPAIDRDGRQIPCVNVRVIDMKVIRPSLNDRLCTERYPQDYYPFNSVHLRPKHICSS